MQLLSRCQEKTNATLLKRFKSELDQLKKPNLVLSAEVLGGGMISEASVASFRAFLSDYVSDFRVIAYVRPPISAVQSSFQQLLKAGAKRFFERPNALRYRRVFEKYDRVFGRENVEVIKYDRATLLDGDVVMDFAHRIGAEIRPEQVIRSNSSVSHESLSLMYSALLKGGAFNNYPGISNDISALVDAMDGYGDKKFAVGTEHAQKVLERNAEDIAWMEDRLGQPLLDAGSTADHAINTVEDLHKTAGDNRRSGAQRAGEYAWRRKRCNGQCARDHATRHLATTLAS